MFEKLMTTVKDPKVLKVAGVAVGALVAIGAAAMVLSNMNDNEDLVDVIEDDQPASEE